MPCCGSYPSGRTPVVAPPIAPAAGTPPVAGVTFEYVGATTLRATGSVTGRDYWFGVAHARVLVDARDAPGLGSVPSLVRVDA